MKTISNRIRTTFRNLARDRRTVSSISRSRF